MKNITEETCSEPEHWRSHVEHCKKAENEYLTMEPHMDELSQQIVINLEEDSDSDDNDNTNESYVSNCEHDLSRISPLD